MELSLSPELEKFIKDKIEGGLYNSTRDVIQESLRLLQTYENLQQLFKPRSQEFSSLMPQIKKDAQKSGLTQEALNSAIKEARKKQ